MTTSSSSGASTPELPALGPTRRLSEVSLQVIGMTVLLVVLLGISTYYNTRTLSAYNLQSLGRETSILALFALGQAIVLIAGGIDLSVGSVLCFVGLNAIWFLSPDYGGSAWSFGLVIPLALLFAATVGLAHGVLVCRLRLPPFMVTLCSLLIFRSLARGITGDAQVSYRPEQSPWFHYLGDGMIDVGPVAIPVPVVILAVVVAALLFFMHYTVYGRYLYAIGFNLEAARFSGVRVDRLRILAFALCGLLAGLAGLLEASYIDSVAPSSAGMAYELYGITAAVLGGCALRGGQGSLLGVVVGAAILKVLQPMIVFVGLPTHLRDAVIGLVLLAAVIADAAVKRRRGY